MRILAPFLASLAVLSGATAAAAQTVATPEPPPRDAELATAPVKRELLAPEYPPSSARASLAIAGTAVFAAWYGAGVGASLLWPDAPGAEELRIPAVGPWLALEHTGCPSRGSCNEVVVVLRAIATVIDGVGQAGGLLAVGEALFLPTASASGERRAPKAELRPAPFVAGQDGIGLGLSGAF